MKLLLQREPSDAHRTHGTLFIEGAFECYTLEDVVRDVKIHSETAIPAGRYRITSEFSRRFGPDTLTINDVPDFTGVRMHAGNTDADTEGCVLVGQVRAAASILHSRDALAELKPKVQAALDAGDDVWLEIEQT